MAEVIEGPAQVAGLELEPGLAARMIEDTRGGDSLPLLADALAALLRMVVVQPDGEPARRPIRRAELPETDYVVIDAFVKARLLTADGDSVSIAHEARCFGSGPR